MNDTLPAGMTLATGHTISRIGVIVAIALGLGRWIGRCKACGTTAKVDGRVAQGTGPEVAVVAIDSTIYTTRIIGDASLILKQCACGRYALLRRVTEGTKKSKHTCGARCTNATGPNCDCRCKGANHGSNC
jgi:hypothetical protein